MGYYNFIDVCPCLQVYTKILNDFRLICQKNDVKGIYRLSGYDENCDFNISVRDISLKDMIPLTSFEIRPVSKLGCNLGLTIRFAQRLDGMLNIELWSIDILHTRSLLQFRVYDLMRYLHTLVEQYRISIKC